MVQTKRLLFEIVVSSAPGQSGRNLSPWGVNVHDENSSERLEAGCGTASVPSGLMEAPETTGLFIHLHLSGTAQEKARYSYLFMAPEIRPPQLDH